MITAPIKILDRVGDNNLTISWTPDSTYLKQTINGNNTQYFLASLQQDYFKKSVVANSILFQFGDALKASLQDDNVIINRGSAKTILSENEVFIQAPLVTVNGNSSRFQTVTSNTITPAVWDNSHIGTSDNTFYDAYIDNIHGTEKIVANTITAPYITSSYITCSGSQATASYTWTSIGPVSQLLNVDNNALVGCPLTTTVTQGNINNLSTTWNGNQIQVTGDTTEIPTTVRVTYWLRGAGKITATQVESNVITANVINATTMNATTITANAVTCTTLTPNVIHAENVDWSSSVLYPAWNSWHTINGTTSVLLSSVVSQVVAGAAYAVQIADINNESITIYGAFVNNDSTQWIRASALYFTYVDGVPRFVSNVNTIVFRVALVSKFR